MSWTWIALLIEILGVIAVFVLVFLIARSLIRYANSLKKGGSSSKQAAEDKKSLFMIYKNVTRYIEVKIALSMPCMAEYLIPLANRTFVVRPRGGVGVSVALFRLESWIRM